MKVEGHQGSGRRREGRQIRGEGEGKEGGGEGSGLRQTQRDRTEQGGVQSLQLHMQHFPFLE